MARPKKTGEGTGTPISLRLTESIQTQLDEAARKLDLPVSELMRLCFRIGVEHFRRIDYDLASCIVQAGQNKSSFKSASDIPAYKDSTQPCAEAVPSIFSSQDSLLLSGPAKPVLLPPQRTLGTAEHAGQASPHSLNESTTPSPPAETRREITYPKPAKKPRRKNGTED